MGFFLLLVVLAVLVLRPAELFPELEATPFYEWSCLACLAVSARGVLGQFTPEGLARRPITLCVLGVLIMIGVSHLAAGLFGVAYQWVYFFASKSVVLYLLLVANVTTVARFRYCLAAVSGLIAALLALAVLQYHGLIEVTALESYRENQFLPSGEMDEVLSRLRGHGIFHDPNDLCVIAGIGLLLALYWTGDRRLGWARFLWAGPVLLSAYAATLTFSRGGLLALMAGGFILVREWLGTRKTMLVAAVALPALIVAVGGRQVRFETDNSNDTSQQRIRAWSDGLVAMRTSPVVGIGQGTYEDVAGLCAHNSFVEAYTELGFVGGTLFFGAIVYPIWALRRVGATPATRPTPELDRARPYLLAIIIALAVGMLSLSRVTNPPTYVLLGLVTAYLTLAAVHRPRLRISLRPELVTRLGLLSVGWLLTLYLFVRLAVQW